MRKIVNGLLYNTATATLIAEAGDYLNNFYENHEALYRTKSGCWFLHGTSSAGGAYGRSSQGGRELSGGEDLVSLTNAQVVEWAENNHLGEGEYTLIAELLGVVEA